VILWLTSRLALFLRCPTPFLSATGHMARSLPKILPPNKRAEVRFIHLSKITNVDLQEAEIILGAESNHKSQFVRMFAPKHVATTLPYQPGNTEQNCVVGIDNWPEPD
jgi:hypothetical protein